ncbi:MAG: hypothetical protein WCG25_04025 [bacterium]
MTIRNIHHHIVGVQDLCLCSSVNITDFSPVAVSSRIVFHTFSFLSILIYKGYSNPDSTTAISANIII